MNPSQTLFPAAADWLPGDAHLHPQDPRIAGESPKKLREAARAGLWIANGTGPDDWDAVEALHREDPSTLASYGVHPWKLQPMAPEWEGLLEQRLLADPAALVGEIGLDRWIEPREEARMETVFRRQLRLAARLGRPASVHSLKADGWLLKILGEETVLPPALLLHSWAGSAETLASLCRYPVFFSVSGYFADPSRTRYQETARRIPLDRLLVETDAPDMLPPPALKPQTLPGDPAGNDPRNLAIVYQWLAQHRGISPATLIDAVASNLSHFLSPVAAHLPSSTVPQGNARENRPLC